MKHILTAIALLWSTCTIGQDSTHYRLSGHTAVFIEPLALIPVLNRAALRIGLETPLSRRISVLGTYGNYFGNGHAFKAGLKYYLQHRGKRYFVETEAWYQEHGYTTYDNIRVTDKDGRPAEGDRFNYDVSKTVKGLCLKFGGRMYQRHFFLEYYYGIGIREKDTRLSVTHEQQNALYHYHESMYQGISDQAGHWTGPSFSAGFRLGWLFKRPAVQALSW